MLLVRKIFFDIDGLVINCTARILETSLELRNVKDVVHFGEILRKFQKISDFTTLC